MRDGDESREANQEILDCVMRERAELDNHTQQGRNANRQVLDLLLKKYDFGVCFTRFDATRFETPKRPVQPMCFIGYNGYHYEAFIPSSLNLASHN